jgi:hypothetical protein
MFIIVNVLLVFFARAGLSNSSASGILLLFLYVKLRASHNLVAI